MSIEALAEIAHRAFWLAGTKHTNSATIDARWRNLGSDGDSVLRDSWMAVAKAVSEECHKDWMNSFNAYVEDARKARKELKATERSLGIIRDERDNVLKELALRTGALNNLTRKKDAIVGENSSLASNVTVLRNERDDARRELALRSAALDGLKKEMEALLKEVDEMQTENERLEAEIDHLKNVAPPAPTKFKVGEVVWAATSAALSLVKITKIEHFEGGQIFYWSKKNVRFPEEGLLSLGQYQTWVSERMKDVLQRKV